MKPTSLILIALVVAAVVAVIALKPARSGTSSESETRGASASVTGAIAPTASTTARPRLLDLGAGKCIPCKLMAPILEDLKTSYVGVMTVDFIDVWEDKAAAQAHGISTIPTQIFFAPDGKELFRHEGFFSKEDILTQWKTLGYDLKPATQAPMPTSMVPAVPAAAAIAEGATCPGGVPASTPVTTEATPPRRKCCSDTP